MSLLFIIEKYFKLPEPDAFLYKSAIHTKNDNYKL